jgi:WD40 repeat protein
MADGSSAAGAGYRAFISYSHKDTAWAKWLLAKLENYTLRGDLLSATDQPEKATSARLGKFFRDRDEAGAATSLADEIRNALARSQHMIVVASPASAKSPYVEQEIREFAALNAKRERPGNILTFIVAGEPNVSADGERAPVECFPPALRGGLKDSDGRLLEPLAADARPTGDGKTRALAKIVSGLTGIRYDALVRRDLQRRRTRRLIAAGIAGALVATAAAVGWRVETDRREKLELRTAREQTDRDRRTLAAVNNAERAQRFLNRGNVRKAVELALDSLVDDNSLPFIPQAYGVLYAAQFQAGKPVNIDLGASDLSGGLDTYSIGGGEYLTADSRGKAVVWSASTGITYSRSDLDKGSTPRRAQSPDGRAIFLKAGDSIHDFRFWPADRSWDRISFSSLDFEGNAPSQYVAVSTMSLIGCGGPGLVAVDLSDKGDGEAKLAWTIDIPGETCNALAISEKGTVLVGTWKGEVIEFDTTTRSEIRRYKNVQNEKDWIRDIVSRQGIIVSRGSDVSVFRYGDGKPFLEFKGGSAISNLSPDGRYVLESVLGFGVKENLVIHDLANGSKVGAECLCTSIGFAGNGDIISLEDKVAVLRSISDAKVIKNLFSFPDKPDRMSHLTEGNVLLAERDLGVETIVPLDGGGLEPLLSGNADVRDMLTSAAYFDEDRIAIVRAHRTGEGIAGFYGAQLFKHAPGKAPEVEWERKGFGSGETGYGSLTVLGHGLIALGRNDSMMDLPKTISIVDPLKDEAIHEMHIISEMEFDAERRHLILETEDDLAIFDLQSRKVTKTGLLTGQSELGRNWFIAGDRLYAGREDTLKGLVLVDDQAVPLEDLRMPGFIHYVCYVPGKDIAYVMASAAEEVLFSQWFLSERKLLSELKYPAKDENDETLTVLTGHLDTWRRNRDEAISCDGQSFKISDLSEKAVRWDVAAKTLSIVPATEPRPAEELFTNAPIERNLLAGARVVFDADKVSVLAGSDNRTLARFDAEYARITTAALSVERGLVAAGFENGELRMWNLAAPDAPLVEMLGHSDAISVMEFSPDGSELLTADGDATVYIWPLPETTALIAASQERDGTELKSGLTPPRN